MQTLNALIVARETPSPLLATIVAGLRRRHARGIVKARRIRKSLESHGFVFKMVAGRLFVGRTGRRNKRPTDSDMSGIRRYVKAVKLSFSA